MKKKHGKNDHLTKRYFLRHLVPVTVWLMALAGVVWLFQQRVQRFEIVGIAQGEVRQIASNCTARINSISVGLFEPVMSGQTLAVVDTIADNELGVEAELRTQIAAAAAEIERLTALLIPTQEQLLSDRADLQIAHADNWRRFNVDVESARLHIHELQGVIASDEITAGQLAMEVKVAEKLLEDGIIVSYELDKARNDYESLAKKIRENQQELEQAKLDLEEAMRRRDEFSRQQLPGQSVSDAVEAIRKEIKVQEELIRGIRDQIAAVQSCRAVELKSPIDGVVIPVHGQANEALLQRPGEEMVRRAGEVVAAGDPLFAVAQVEPTEIVAYVSEQQIGLMDKDMSVELVKIRYPAQIARSHIVSIAPTIEVLPQRLWRNPTVPQWGRPVLIEIPTGLSLVPGELVGIRGL